MIDDHSTPIAPLNKSKIRRMRKKRVIESDDSTDSNNETEHTNDPYSVTNNSDSNDDSTDKEHGIICSILSIFINTNLLYYANSKYLKQCCNVLT